MFFKRIEEPSKAAMTGYLILAWAYGRMFGFCVGANLFRLSCSREESSLATPIFHTVNGVLY